MPLRSTRARSFGRLAVWSALALLGAAASACAGDDHPAQVSSFGSFPDAGTPGDDFDSGIPEGPPPCPEGEDSGLCACEEVIAVADAPNLYFVFDASGSMAAAAPPAASRYEAVRASTIELVRNLGPLINVGAAVFPYKASSLDPCRVGAEIFPVTQGDPVTGVDGPTTAALSKATKIDPEGGTPTAATLLALAPALKALPGKTYVLLSTDGGPNCNLLTSCGIEDCIPNIENTQGCDTAFNCCDPKLEGSPGNCLDKQPTIDAVKALADAGIVVYVIGITGSEKYESVLNEMAQAGGAAPPLTGTTWYYKVDDLEGLGDVFATIASIAVSCDFDLGTSPPAKELTNVYLDGTLLPYEPLDGWGWVGDTTVQLRGATCIRLKGGQIKKVQIVAGCPTEGPL